MKDFLTFRRMLTLVFIQAIFWAGVLVSLISAVIDFSKGQVVLGFMALIIGPILVRIGCELLILFFRMNETLTDINQSIKDK